MKRAPLTPKQRRFVEEYLVDLNGTQAAIRAGYSSNGAEVTASQLLRNPKVARAVETAMGSRSEKTGITQERVLRELATLAFSDVRHYQVDDYGKLELALGAPDDAWRAVSSVKHRTVTTGEGDDARTTHEVEFKLWDKPGTLKLAGRHVALKGFFDKLEVTGKDGGPIEAVITEYEIPANNRDKR